MISDGSSTVRQLAGSLESAFGSDRDDTLAISASGDGQSTGI